MGRQLSYDLPKAWTEMGKQLSYDLPKAWTEMGKQLSYDLPKAWTEMGRQVLVSLLKPVVLSNVMKVITAYHNGPLHLQFSHLNQIKIV